MPVSYGTFKAHAGFATELVYGTTIAAPAVWTPFISWDTYNDDQNLLMDETARGKASKLYAAYAGMARGGWSATFPYYPTVCARFWGRMLGLDTIGSSSQGGWQHNFTLADIPPSDTVFLFYGSTGSLNHGPEVQFVGSQYTSVNFKFSRESGYATIKADAMSFAPSTGIAETSPTYSADFALRGYQGIFSVGGSTRINLLDYDLTLTRQAEYVYSANNSRVPQAIEVGPLDVTGKVRFYGSTDGPYVDYRANTQQAIDLVLNDTVPGTTMNRLQITLSKAVFTKVTPNISGKYLVYDAEFRGIYNSSAGGDSGPMQVFTTIATSSSLSS